MPANFSKKNEAKLRFFLETKDNDTQSSNTKDKDNSTCTQADKRLQGRGCDRLPKKR